MRGLLENVDHDAAKGHIIGVPNKFVVCSLLFQDRMQIEKGNKKIISAWCWYDWATSVYPLVITTAVFPIYFGAVTKTGEVSFIEVFGRQIVNTEFYSYLVALSFLMVAMISPILSGIADYAGRKRLFMQLFSSIGAMA